LQYNIDELLSKAVDDGATDVHLKVGSPPVIRVQGDLRRLEGFKSLKPEDTKGYAEAMFSEKASGDFEQNGVADFAYGTKELGRFRVTAFRQRGSVSLVLRSVVPGTRSFSELGLPRAVEKLVASSSGLVLITGRSGSGKTTTIASMIDWINSNRAHAILTVEDPIEVLHPDKKAVVVQREVGVDTPDIASAVRSAVRHDVDVIMISEINDPATARAAIDAAETGRLVISSMRTTDPADTINRLVSMFPEAERPAIRQQVATQVTGIISQVLIETTDSKAVLACEVMTNNERSQEWMLSNDDGSRLVEILKDGGFYGMQTFDQALLRHVVDKKVDIGVALPHVRNTHEIRAKAMEAGIAS
jgi:twitching motility protein PilT